MFSFSRYKDLVHRGVLRVPEGTNINVHEEDFEDTGIKKGFFFDEDLERRVQPGSFDQALDGKMFIIDTQKSRQIRPKKTKVFIEQFYKSLQDTEKEER